MNRPYGMRNNGIRRNGNGYNSMKMVRHNNIFIQFYIAAMIGQIDP